MEAIADLQKERVEEDSSRNGSGITLENVVLNGTTSVPTQWRSQGPFSVTRLRSRVGLQDRITKLSAVPAVLVSMSLKGLGSGAYQVWADGKQAPITRVAPYRANVIDFGAEPGCWAGDAFDYMHMHVPREELVHVAEDLGFGPVGDFKAAIAEEDLVLAQLTRSLLPALENQRLACAVALDYLQLVLGAHLLQRYGAVKRTARAIGGLAPWQKRRAVELLRSNLDGALGLKHVAKECGLSPSHFARSFKVSFGLSVHKWLIRCRVDRAKELLLKSGLPLVEVAERAGFGDQAAFTRTFHAATGASPGRWRRDNTGYSDL